AMHRVFAPHTILESGLGPYLLLQCGGLPDRVEDAGPLLRWSHQGAFSRWGRVGAVSLSVRGSRGPHWFQLAGESRAPRSLRATASVTAPHTKPKASTTTMGTFPRLRP